MCFVLCYLGRLRVGGEFMLFCSPLSVLPMDGWQGK